MDNEMDNEMDMAAKQQEWKILSNFVISQVHEVRIC